MFRLDTPRIVLRDLTDADVELIARMAREPSIIRYQSWLRLDSPEDLQRWVRDAVHHNSLQPREAYNLVIEERATGQPVGWIGWGRPSDPQQGDYSFGYALLPGYWGRGYMTEALRAAIRFMFVALGASRISDFCECGNVASARVMEKCGMSPVERWAELSEDNECIEYVRYAIERTDPPARSEEEAVPHVKKAP